MSHSSPPVPIVEDFAGYTPPDWVRPTIERLLASLPAAHTAGLGAIVLSNSATATTRKVMRARRQRHGAFLGRYHHARKGDRAWVEPIRSSWSSSSSRRLR